MSYSVHVFPRATQAAHAKQKKKSPAFFEKESALPKFTKAALDELLEHMELVGCSNADWGALQFGSELAGDELAKYDPQENTWE